MFLSQSVPETRVVLHRVSARNSGSATPCQYPKLGFRYTMSVPETRVPLHRVSTRNSRSGESLASVATRAYSAQRVMESLESTQLSAMCKRCSASAVRARASYGVLCMLAARLSATAPNLLQALLSSLLARLLRSTRSAVAAVDARAKKATPRRSRSSSNPRERPPNASDGGRSVAGSNS